MDSNKCLKNDHGFTLIEVMITMAVLAIGLSALVLLTTSNSKYNRTANESSVATTFAQQKMEELLTKGNSNFEDDDLLVANSPYTGNTITSDNNRTYDLSWEVDYYDPGTGPDLGTKIITLTVSWTGQSGYREVELQTILTQG